MRRNHFQFEVILSIVSVFYLPFEDIWKMRRFYTVHNRLTVEITSPFGFFWRLCSVLLQNGMQFVRHRYCDSKEMTLS